MQSRRTKRGAARRAIVLCGTVRAQASRAAPAPDEPGQDVLITGGKDFKI